jgi:competence protein ComEA
VVWTGGSGGERARVAARVRALLEASPDAHGAWVPGDDLLDPGRGGLDATTEAIDDPFAQPPAAAGVGSGTGFVGAAAARGVGTRRVRWAPDSRGAIGLGLVVLVAVVATLWWVLSARPHSQAIGPVGSGGPAGSAGTADSITSTSSAGGSAAVPGGGPTGPSGGGSFGPSGSSSATVLVDVAGKVRRPGVYRLPAGSRIYQAIRAAGGARPGVSTTALNLAATVTDGQQIVVGGRAPPVSEGGGQPGSSTPSTATPVDLNTATLEQLESLPGVGPVLGQNILDRRNAHGQFASTDQLQQVPGIGDVRMAQLQPLVTV